ncbi:hypothetical protein K8942_00905 [Candidatus Peribacteria bacterium]|nr:MAG: hypothetical protein K8942_00905 [Candidatus Peribacteria bacterium]
MKSISQISTDTSPEAIASMERRICDIFQRTQKNADDARDPTDTDTELFQLRTENESAFLRAVLQMKKHPAQEMVRQMIVRSICAKVRGILDGNGEV